MDLKKKAWNIVRFLALIPTNFLYPFLDLYVMRVVLRVDFALGIFAIVMISSVVVQKDLRIISFPRCIAGQQFGYFQELLD